MNKWGITQILAGYNIEYKPLAADGAQVAAVLAAATLS